MSRPFRNVARGHEQWEVFSFINRAKTIKQSRDGRMAALEITLSDWVFNAINKKSGDILTISREYFRLCKPLERRLYKLARKHCGQNSKWLFRVERMGSASTLKSFTGREKLSPGFAPHSFGET